jgi:sugar (pentulose or hexulose) kinase
MQIAGRLKEFVQNSFPLEARLTFPEAALLTGAVIGGHNLLYGNPMPASEEKKARDAIELQRVRLESEANRIAKDKMEQLSRRLNRAERMNTPFTIDQYGGDYSA